MCKDAKGKVGMSMFAESKGVFVSYVKSGSPGAIAGLRFGDQILQVKSLEGKKCIIIYTWTSTQSREQSVVGSNPT